MYLADYHTHSRISPDARTSMEEMTAAAVRAGLDEICFTDHLEPIVLNAPDQEAEPYDWDALCREFDQARDVWGSRIQMRLGVELGDAPWNFAWCERMLAQAPELDFIIGSIHLLSPKLGGQNLYFFDPTNEDGARRGIVDYLSQVQRLADWGGFTVLGHLTLPLRYLNENRGHHLTFDGFEEPVEQILRSVIRQGHGIELNTNRGHQPLPDEKWLKMFRRLGGEVITLGTDAHAPNQVGCAIAERQALLKHCGFHRFCTFDRQKPVWHEL